MVSEEKMIKININVDYDYLVYRIIFVILACICISISYLLYYEYNTYRYECIDTKGNSIYCDTISVNKGTAWGTMSDGTKVEVIQYKRISREEVKDE